MAVGDFSRTKRETVVNGRTSATAGTATIATVTTIDGASLEEFDEIIVHIPTSVSLAGTTPTLDIYFQQALVPNPDPTVDAHWDDWAKAVQITGGSSQVLTWAIKPRGVTGTNNTSGTQHNRGIDQAGFTGGNAFQNHWGDRLRVREVMGGTISTQAVYSIHMTGLQRGGRRGI